MPERLVVIGGDAGGMAAAAEVRRRQPYTEIVALEKGSWTSYSACGIPYLVAGDVATLDDLVVRTPAAHREQRIDVRLRHEVLGIDLAARTLEVRDHARQRTIPIEFDRLHVANGIVTHAARSAGHRPRPRAGRADPRRRQGAPRPRPRVALPEGRRRGRWVHRAGDGGGVRPMGRRGHARRGLGPAHAHARCRHGRPPPRADAGHGHRRAAQHARRRVRAWAGAAGRRPRAARRARRPGARRHAEQRAGERGRGGHRRAGGARGRPATAHHARRRLRGGGLLRVAPPRVRPPHAPRAGHGRQAAGPALAGINLAGGYATFPGVVGTAITKVCNLEVGRTGLTEREAAAEGFETVATSIDTTTIAGYMPDTKPMSVKLVAERGTGRVLGAEIVGEEGSAKRIDTVATALHARMRVDELIDLDLAYAPPFASAWDPIHIVARRLVAHL